MWSAEASLSSPFEQGIRNVLDRHSAVAVVVEASAPKVYPRVALASASTLSGSVVRTLRGGEGLPKIFCLVASSLGHLCSQCSIVCGSSLQRGHSAATQSPRPLRSDVVVVVLA